MKLHDMFRHFSGSNVPALSKFDTHLAAADMMPRSVQFKMCFLLFNLALHANAMFNKRPIPNRGPDKRKKLRANLNDLFLQGEVSRARAHSLYEDASHIDEYQFEDMARAGNEANV